jgi:hypothetical protein
VNICSFEDADDDESMGDSAFPPELKTLLLEKLPFATILQFSKPLSKENFETMESRVNIFGELGIFLKDRGMRAINCLANIFGIISGDGRRDY